ncbi:MAG: glycosyltransferase family 2 protein [Patescibacteria group bacterium]
MNKPAFSFVILNYRTKELVRECIANIYRANIQLAFEIIVVDNSRDAGLEEILEQRYPRVRYIPLARNIGCAAGNNVGMNAARGEYIIISNADVTLLSGALEMLYRFLHDHQDVGIVGPRLLNPDGSIQESYYRFYRLLTPVYRRLWIGKLPFARKHIEAFLMKDIEVNGPTDVDSLMGAFLIARRSAVQKVGLFDERFFLYFSDTDWCMRFWQNGFRVVYHSSAQLIHLHKRQSAQRMGLHSIRDTATRIHIIDGIRYFLKYPMTYART